MFDDAAQHLSQHDPILARVIAASPRPDLQPHHDYYRALVQSIIGQQLSVKAAASIRRRFEELFGDGFPTPEHILKKDIDELRSAGLSQAKAVYIRDLARHVTSGQVQFDRFDQLSNAEIIQELTAVKGIGEWTAHMFLLFCMGRLDVLPTGDLGIKNGIKSLYDFAALPTAADIEQLAATNHWHPYESIASWYIWRSLDNTPT